MMDKGFKKALCALFALSLTFSSFAEVPDWLLGTWTYGDLNVTFTTDTIIVKEGNITVSKGTYTLDVGGYVVPEWEGYDHEEGDEDMLIADSYNKKVCIEGGPWLEKFATNTGTIDNEDFGLNNVVDSYIKSSKPYIGNIMWAYGVWKLKDTRACIYITPLYIKSIGINDDYLDGKDVKDVDKKWEVARAEEYELIGNAVRIGNYYLDIPSKMIYSLRGIDEKTYLEKVEDYQNWKIALAVIILLGIVVTVAILVIRLIIKLIRWLIRIIRTFRERVQKTVLSAGAAIKKKKIEVTESVKNYKDHTGAQISAYKSNNHLTKFAKLAAVVVAAFLMIHWCGDSDSDTSDNSEERTESTESHSTKSSDSPTFASASDVMSYLTRHKFVSSDGIEISVRRDGLYANGSVLTTSPQVDYFNGQRAIVSAWSPYRGTTITLYVYADEGHIVDGNDNAMYFAK